MRTKKAYELVGMQLTYDMGENIKAVIEGFVPEILADTTVNDAKELACRIHLGYASPDDVVRSIIQRGADWAVEYFRKGDVREIRGGWYHPLSYGLLLCLLIQDNRKVASLCSWPKPTKRPEYKGPLEDEIQLMYLVLGSLFQQSPDKRFENLRTKIAASRLKNVRVLSRALDAVVARDQNAFANAIEECVKHHMTKPKPEPDAYFMEDWLPLHANTIYLAGLQLGLDRPDYPPEVAAYLMTPESVGF